MSFQSVVDENLHKGFVGVAGGDLTEERRKLIYDRAAEGTARFFAVKDAIAHAKTYMLECEGLKRVVVSSVNLSEMAFPGRQAETLIAFENDETAWTPYSTQYESVREIAVSLIEIRPRSVIVADMPLTDTPILKEAESKSLRALLSTFRRRWMRKPNVARPSSSIE